MKRSMLYLLFVLAATPVFAGEPPPTNNTNVTIDVTKLDNVTRNAVLDVIAEQQKTTLPSPTTAQTVKEWAGFGKDIGDAVAATAKSLGVAVNDFIKTPAGHLVVWIILLKLFGQAIWGIFAGLTAWIVLGTLWWKSFNRFIFGVPNKKTGERSPYPFNKNTKSGADVAYPGRVWTVILHIAALFLICGLCGPAVIYAFQ